MTTRSERLGLEPGSILPRFEATGGASAPMPATQPEIAHSIAISLKRIADRLDLNSSHDNCFRSYEA